MWHDVLKLSTDHGVMISEANQLKGIHAALHYSEGDLVVTVAFPLLDQNQTKF